MNTICCVGDLVTDVVVHMATDPQRGTDTPVSIHHQRGGSAANVAVAAAASGAAARFVGQVGDDLAGKTLTDALELLGVDVFVVRRGVTGTIVVLVDAAGERSFLTDRAAAVHLSSVPAGALDGVDLLHVPAYSLTIGALAETSQLMIGEAVDRNIPISMSTSSVSVLKDYGRARFLDLVKAINPALIVANREEASFLLQGHPWFRHAGATVVTASDMPARFVQPNGTEVRASPTPVKATDTTGAGDAFTGAFLAAHLRGESPEACLRAGHDLARRTLEHPGASLGS